LPEARYNLTKQKQKDCILVCILALCKKVCLFLLRLPNGWERSWALKGHSIILM